MKRSLLVFALILPVPAATVTLVPSKSNPAPGEFFSAGVQVSGVFDGLPGEELILFGFDIQVNHPGAVAYLGFSPSPLFDAAGLAGAEVSGYPKTFSLAEGDFIEPLLLATLNFQRLTNAPATIRIFADPDGNPDHGLFYLRMVLPLDASASIEPVPEPSALSLAFAATLAVWLTRRFSRLR